MSEEIRQTFWTSMQTIGAMLVVFLVGLFIRFRDLLRIGKNTVETTEAKAKSEREAAAAEMLAVKNELTRDLQSRLATRNEELSQVRERVAKLEESVATFKRYYDDAVIENRELRSRIENSVADLARLKTEKHNLERRLSGALRRLSENGIHDEQDRSDNPA